MATAIIKVVQIFSALVSTTGSASDEISAIETEVDLPPPLVPPVGPAMTSTTIVKPKTTKPSLKADIETVNKALNMISDATTSINLKNQNLNITSCIQQHLLDDFLLPNTNSQNLLNIFITKRPDEFREAILEQVFDTRRLHALRDGLEFLANDLGLAMCLFKDISFYVYILNAVLSNPNSNIKPTLVDFIDKAISLCLMASENVKAECSKLQSDILKKTDDLIALAKTAVQKNSIDLNTENMKKFNVLDLDFILENVQKIRLAVLSSLTRQNIKQIVLFRNMGLNSSFSPGKCEKRRVDMSFIFNTYRDIVMNLLEATTIYIRLLLLDISDAYDKQLALIFLQKLTKAFQMAVSQIICMAVAPHRNGYNYKMIHEFADKLWNEKALRDFTNIKSVTLETQEKMPVSKIKLGTEPPAE